MKRIRIIGVISLLQLLGFSSCVYPYEAAGVESVEPMLVVEGDIIANDITHITLSLSTPLGQSFYPTVSHALVYVEDEQQGRYQAIETAPGHYEAPTQNLNLDLRYRLYIELNDQRKYASDYVPVCVSPPIDSVGYTVLNADRTALDFHVSTHDPGGNSRYYKWEYIEDWEIHVPYFSVLSFSMEDLQYHPRPYEENIYYCWNKGASSSILLGNSSRLLEDVVTKAPLLRIWMHDTRNSPLYCIQVTQKVLTQEAYVYWETLRKNSEDMGGIFSNQPSELRGNIYALDNADEIVLGYVSASTVSQTGKLFFSPDDVIKKRLTECEEPRRAAPSNIDWAITFHQQSYIPIGYEGNNVVWMLYLCVDCRNYGTKDRPSWWPNDHI